MVKPAMFEGALAYFPLKNQQISFYSQQDEALKIPGLFLIFQKIFVS